MEQQHKGILKIIIICIVAAIVLFAILSTTKKEDASPIARGEMTLIGTSVCLPHRDSTGPQTMECAFGLKAEDGKRYALDTAALAPESVALAQTTQTEIIATGNVVPVAALSNDQWQKYDIVGIMHVTSIGVVNNKQSAVDKNVLLGKWTGVEGTSLMVSKIVS